MPSASGQGAVAIWHDIVPEGLAEFYAWHGEEHMPERVGIPGFLRGRRFRAIEASLEFFNLYETASPDVVAGPDYKARLDSPTPRTMSAVKHFRNVARSLCSVGAVAGEAQGGTVATLRYEVREGGEEAHAAAMARTLVPDLATRAGIAAVRWLVADKAASGYVNAEQRARGAANAVPPYVLLCEGWGDPAQVTEALKAVLPAGRAVELGMHDMALDLYRHEVTVSR
ncbi:hypothetical protein [uncultured Alsobacter sp.]|uniref:hypothetical protein n=1 Tax=uncultured Alsobacter sp. TaxID=1748258 RepID=UPI0025E5C5EF|nr:hypothetical protein [uncultured Alsobacter sp.]